MTLQLRGKYGIPLKTIENLLERHNSFCGTRTQFNRNIARLILLNGRFYAGTFSNQVELPLFLTPKLSFLSGIVMGDGSIDEQSIRISNGFESSRKNIDFRKEKELIKEDLEIVSSLFKDIFNIFSTKLSCHSENYDGIVIQAKPILRFFNRVLGHPIHSKNYENGIWKPDKLKIPHLMIKCRDKKIFLAYACGLFCSDGTITTKDYRLDSISKIVYSVGNEIVKRFCVKAYFNKRLSTSRGKIVKDKIGNTVWRHTLILCDTNFLKLLFSVPFSYPSRKNRIKNLSSCF